MLTATLLTLEVVTLTRGSFPPSKPRWMRKGLIGPNTEALRQAFRG